MKVRPRPVLTDRGLQTIVDMYSKKDGVPVKYVCTTALDSSTVQRDIFYRETPHPEFGNRYFSIHFVGSIPYISDADRVEDLEFVCLKGPHGWEYSQHRWDYRQVGAMAIDGGRAYTRFVGDGPYETKTFKVKDGDFVEVRGD